MAGHDDNRTCPTCGEGFANQVCTYRLYRRKITTFHRRCTEPLTAAQEKALRKAAGV